jgi:hypothetical protein
MKCLLTCDGCPAAAVQCCEEGALSDHSHAGVLVVQLGQELAGGLVISPGRSDKEG